MVSWKLSAIALVLLSAGMANVISKLEASFKAIAVHAVTATHNYAALTMAEEKAIEKEVEILRDGFMLAWIVGGCIPGACVGIWIRAITGLAEIAKTFGASMFTSFCVSPWVIKHYVAASPESCLIVSFLVAVGAWLAWEIAMVIGNRLKDAAKKNGWFGVKQELLGTPAAKPNEPATVTVGNSS